MASEIIGLRAATMEIERSGADRRSTERMVVERCTATAFDTSSTDGLLPIYEGLPISSFPEHESPCS